jgi:hypothetical protein
LVDVKIWIEVIVEYSTDASRMQEQESLADKLKNIEEAKKPSNAGPDLEEFRGQLEKGDLSEGVSRLDELISIAGENATLPALGARLALEMGTELKEKLPLGIKSGGLLVEWAEIKTSEEIEEVVSHARLFLTNPASLVENMRKVIFGADEE